MEYPHSVLLVPFAINEVGAVFVQFDGASLTSPRISSTAE
jgi:hypothetical protein